MIKPTTLDDSVVSVLLSLLKEEYTAFVINRNSANYLAGIGFQKAAKHYESEAQDELTHAKKIEDYLTGWNVKFQLPNIDKSEIVFSGLESVLEEDYKKEYALYEKYEKEAVNMFSKDACTYNLLQEFVEIQRKSVFEASDRINMLEGVEPTKFNLLDLEKKLF